MTTSSLPIWARQPGWVDGRFAYFTWARVQKIVLACVVSIIACSILLNSLPRDSRYSLASPIDELRNKAYSALDGLVYLDSKVNSKSEIAYFRKHGIHSPGTWGKTFNPPNCIRGYVAQRRLLQTKEPLKNWSQEYPRFDCPIYPIPKDGFLLHMQWDGEWVKDFYLTLDSFLATQNLKIGLKLIWWYGANTPPPPEVLHRYATIASKHIEFKELDRLAEGAGTCLDKMPDWNSEAHQAKVGMKPDAVSDMIRVMLLNKYGGAWIDSDTVFIRDITDRLRLGPTAPGLFAPSGMYNNHFINAGPSPSPEAAKLLQTMCSLSFQPKKWPHHKYHFKPFARRSFNDGLLKVCEHHTHCGFGVVPLAMVESTAWTERDTPLLTPCDSKATRPSVNSALKKTWLWRFRRSCPDDPLDVGLYPFAEVRRKVDAILQDNLLDGNGRTVLPGA